MRATLLTAALIIAAMPCHAQPPRYVTDALRLEARSGPGTTHRILRYLESGTQVRVLEDSDGWSRVRAPDGEEMWILTRYLTDEPAARDRLTAVTAQLDAARAEIAALNEELAALREEKEAVVDSHAALSATTDAIAAELAELKRTASAAVALKDENEALKSRSGDLAGRLEVLQEEYVTLRHARSRDWFLAGAGVLAGGLLLGLIIPRIRWRRRRSWSEL